MLTTLTRLALLAPVLFVGLSLSPQGATPAKAGVEYPWCAIYSERNVGATNCGFVSLRQCMATIQGLGGMCNENPNYVGPPMKPRKVRKDYR